MEQQMNYVFKTLFIYNEDRLPHKLSKLMLDKKIYWAETWCNSWPLEDDLNWVFSLRTKEVWAKKIKFHLNNMRLVSYYKMCTEALNSSHGIYRYIVGQNAEYITDTNLKINEIAWIFKARAGLLGLNTNVQSNTSTKNCSLCNMREEETITHFLGVCPMLKDIRKNYLNIESMTVHEVVSLLNGQLVSWNLLQDYILKCYHYRAELISEFNF